MKTRTHQKLMAMLERRGLPATNFEPVHSDPEPATRKAKTRRAKAQAGEDHEDAYTEGVSHAGDDDGQTGAP